MTFETTVLIEADQCYVYLPHMRELAAGKTAARTVRFEAVGAQLTKMGFVAVDFDDQGRVVGVELSGFNIQVGME